MEYILHKTQINIVSQRDNELKIYFSVVWSSTQFPAKNTRATRTRDLSPRSSKSVTGHLPNKSHHLDELTHEPTIWSCDACQWLSHFDSLSIDHIVNVQYKRCGFAKTRLRYPSLPFDSLPYPTRTICRRVRTLGHVTTKQKEVDHIP